jgi:hypothetical protein
MITIRQAVLRSGIVLALAGVTFGMCSAFPNAADAAQAGMVLRLPENTDKYVSQLVPPSKEEEEWLPSDTGLLKRRYYPRSASSQQEALRRSLLASLILSGNDRRSLHRPQVCLEAAGWTIWKKTPTTIKVEGKEPFDVMDYSIRRQDKQADGSMKESRAHYVYWWVGKSATTSSDFRRVWITVMDNIFRNINNVWGYPSVTTFVDLKEGATAAESEAAEEDARDRAMDFIHLHAPMFQKSLGAEELADPSSGADSSNA